MASDLLNFSQASQFFMNLGMIIALLLIGAVVVFAALRLFLFMKKWGQYKCRIFYKDGAGNLLIKTDDGGVFKDAKTKNQMFFVRKMRTSMKPDNIPFLLEGKKKVAYFIQVGEKNLRPITDWSIIDGNLKAKVLEEDVNWAVQAYEREKKLLELGIWEKVLPFLIILIPTIAIMIVLLAFFNKFEVLVQVAQYLAEAAKAQAGGGTMIVPAG